MTGTATEVAPIRAVDDIELGVGPGDAGAAGRATSTRSTGAASAGATGWTWSRRRARTRERRSCGRSRSRRPGSTSGRRSWSSTSFARVGCRSGRPSTASKSCSRKPSARRTRRPSRAAQRGCICSASRPGSSPATRSSRHRIRSSPRRTAPIYEGATPVFADIDPRTWNLDPAAVEAAITPRTKAVVAVDIYGYPSELEELQALCTRHGLALIDDACEALGTRYNGRPIAAHGQDAVFAFYPNKQLTMGEGGVVTTHSEETWRLLKSLRNQGRADSGGWLEHARLGFNYRLDDIRAAIGIGQLEKLDADPGGALARPQPGTLACSPASRDWSSPCPDDDRHVRSWFVYVVALPVGADRERVIEGARRCGCPVGALSAVHPSAAVHERTLRLPGRALPGGRGSERPNACSAVPHTDLGGRPGVRRRRTSRRPDVTVRRTSQGEGLAVWALFAADVLAVLVVYSLVDPSRLHNVSHGGLAGGLSRAFVHLSFPVAIVAVALDPARARRPAVARAGGSAAPRSPSARSSPGRVSSTRTIWTRSVVNIVPALGVALALGLTIAAVRTGRGGVRAAAARRPHPGRRRRRRRARLAALDRGRARRHFPPWLFLTDEPYREPGERVTAAVHLGHHHGLAGTLFFLAALVLSRPAVSGTRLRLAYGFLVSLLLVYGATTSSRTVARAGAEARLDRAGTFLARSSRGCT